MSRAPRFEQAGRALGDLMELAATLRAPGGCPWDRKQTPQSAARYLLEEACEAFDALESQGPEQVLDELGDVLFQVVFQAQLFAEQNRFDLAEVIRQVQAKMTRRHPHVFGPRKADNPDEVLDLWREVKEQERGGRPAGLLEGVPRSLPSLMRAQALGQKAAKVGFDWQNAEQVWQKVEEEAGELAEARDDEARRDELGDILFALAQWARHRGLDADRALRQSNRKFSRRFELMEKLARAGGKSLDDLDDLELDRLWEEAKALLAGSKAG